VAEVVHCCLLEIADVQILSQGGCLAKNLTISRFPIERPTFLSQFTLKGGDLNLLLLNTHWF